MFAVLHADLIASGLNHKIRDDAVKNQSAVELLFDEVEEVVDMLWGKFR